MDSLKSEYLLKFSTRGTPLFTLVPALMGTKLRKAFQAEATSSTKEKKTNNSGTGEAQCVSGTEIVSVFGVELKSPNGTREAEPPKEVRKNFGKF